MNRRRGAALAGIVAFTIAWWLTAGPHRAYYEARIWLCALGAVAVVVAQRTHAGDSDPAGRMRHTIAIVALVAWCGAGLGAMLGPELQRLAVERDIRTWSVFHYYTGAEYFGELGYTGLYDQAVVCDTERDGYFSRVRRIRNLETYELEPTAAGTRTRLPQWTDERWSGFCDVVTHLQPGLTPKTWRRVLRDRGFNATPTWTTIGGVLTNVPATADGLAALVALDPLMLLAAFFVLGRVFGPLRALVAGTWLALYFGNEDHLVGGIYQYDWLAAVLLAACALERRRDAAAGALLAYGAMVRIFPGFLLLGGAIWAWKRRRDPASRLRTRRFGIAFASACGALFLLGCLNPRGPRAWPEFLDNIGLHADQHRFGNQRIGLQHLLMRDLGDPLGPWEKRAERHAAWDRQGAAAPALAVVFGLLWLAAAARREDDRPLEPMVASLALVWAGIVLSRYYWSVAVLWFFVGGRERDGPLGGRDVATVAAALLGWCVVVFGVRVGSDSNFGWYWIANLLLGGALAWTLGRRAVARDTPASDPGDRSSIEGPPPVS